MINDLKITEEARKPLSMHPKKFALWLFISSVVMLFAAWTSAYIVKRGDTGWTEIVLPAQFWINSVIIILSSITMILAVQAARKDNMEKAKLMLVITAVLGFAFLIGQLLAYREMIAVREYFTGGNVSHSFIYVLTGVHGLHIVSGLIFILVTLNMGSAFKWRHFLKLISIIGFLVMALTPNHKLKVSSKNMAQLEMCATYWHFLGILWLYLFVFLLLNK